MSDPVMPVIIALPPEIDLTKASGVLELITAACAPGVAVVVADLTGTSFCDSAGLRHLIRATRPPGPARNCGWLSPRTARSAGSSC